MALKKLLAIPKDGYLLLLDCDDEEDDMNFLEEAHSEENESFSVEWQRFASSVETPIENRNLLSGEQQDGNASKLDLMEVQNPVTHDDENEIPEEIVGDTREMIKSKSCEQYKTTFQKFDMDVQNFNEEQEKSVNNYQKEDQLLKLSKCSQSHSLEAIKYMHDRYMKSLMNLETNIDDMLFDVDDELRK